MRRALISTVAIVCAATATAAVPVVAAAPLAAGRAAQVSVRTTLPDGKTLTLDITAAQLTSGPHLIVDTTTCVDDGCAADVYEGTLTSSELSIDPSANVASLDATLAGRRLAIHWQPSQDSGYTTGPGTSTGHLDGFFASDFVGSLADAAVQYDGSGCAGSGGVGTAVSANASTEGSDEAEPLTALALPSGAQLSC